MSFVVYDVRVCVCVISRKCVALLKKLTDQFFFIFATTGSVFKRHVCGYMISEARPPLSVP